MSAVILKWMAAVAVSDYGVVLISSFESFFCIFSYLHFGWNDWSAFCVVRSFRMMKAPSLSKINEKFMYKPKPTPIISTKVQVRKDTKNTFKA